VFPIFIEESTMFVTPSPARRIGVLLGGTGIRQAAMAPQPDRGALLRPGALPVSRHAPDVSHLDCKSSRPQAANRPLS
jgi:hypothetical protein